MLNSIGLQNIGVGAFVRDKLPLLRRHDIAVVANIWGRTIDEYVGVARHLDPVEGVHGIELNVSCPNIKEGGISFGTSEVQIHTVTAAVRRVTGKPLWVKLAPGVTDIGAIARAAEEGGADALSVINTIRGMLIDTGKRRPVLSSIFGGFSGPALFPLALYCLYEVKLATSLPLIGIGGINGLDQVLQFLIAGASAVQIGTANFYDPTISQRMVDELDAWLDREGLSSVADLVGTLECPRPT
jgi:dihydroorotate dehydrogenase (NAD+) catalytic subunit